MIAAANSPSLMQESPNGMASASQADICGFEPRLLLQTQSVFRDGIRFFLVLAFFYARFLSSELFCSPKISKNPRTEERIFCFTVVLETFNMQITVQK